ncbi:MAG TPA: Sec-independent protein translocase protein TatB [Geminicoccaceae bacterium]|nr:Sec-independent protein translocase protein TatB [Geminicoccaceae bacterium]
MFDIGWSEMAVILLVALIVIGPKDLPRVARTMGRWAAKGRAMAREFQTALEDMAREAELDKVKNEIEKAGRTNVGKTIEKTIDPSGELGKAFDPKTISDKSSGGNKPNGGQAKSPPTENSSLEPAVPATAALAEAEPAKSPPVKASPAKSSPAKSSPAKSSPAKSSPAKSSPAKSSPAKSSPASARAKPAPRAKPKEKARETAPAEPS